MKVSYYCTSYISSLIEPALHGAVLFVVYRYLIFFSVILVVFSCWSVLCRVLLPQGGASLVDELTAAVTTINNTYIAAASDREQRYVVYTHVYIPDDTHGGPIATSLHLVRAGELLTDKENQKLFRTQPWLTGALSVNGPQDEARSSPPRQRGC